VVLAGQSNKGIVNDGGTGMAGQGASGNIFQRRAAVGGYAFKSVMNPAQ